MSAPMLSDRVLDGLREEELVDEIRALERRLAAEDLPPVAVAFARAAADVRHVGKDRTVDSSAGGYAYRSVDDVYDAVHVALAAHGVTVLPDVLEHATDTHTTGSGTKERHVTVKLNVRIVGPRGDELAHTTYGEGLDRRDRATQKAITDGFKYALLRALTIPVTGDASDEGHADPRRPEAEDLAAFIAEALAAEIPVERVAAGVAFASESRDNLARAVKGLEHERTMAARARGEEPPAEATREAERGAELGPLPGRTYGELNAAGLGSDAARHAIARLVTGGRDEGPVASTRELGRQERKDVELIARGVGHGVIALEIPEDGPAVIRRPGRAPLEARELVSLATVRELCKTLLPVRKSTTDRTTTGETR